VGVIGAGGWGTALAGLLAEGGHQVHLWAREAEVVRQIREESENRSFLPGARLPEELQATGDLQETVAGAEMVLSVVPSQFVSSVMSQAVPFIERDAQVVSATKGIELSTLRRMDQVLEGFLSPDQMERFTVLSGPSFAKEVAEHLPTAVVVASHSEDARVKAQMAFQSSRFRVYTNEDVIGVELAGALKNVIALAAGVVAGLGFGHNTRAALITRGLAEITRLGAAMGASRATFAGLAGMGDLVLTCTGDLSRNRTVGYRLGQGEQLRAILEDMPGIPEGVRTAEAVQALAGKHQVEMPISREVCSILVEGKSPRDAVQDLMLRAPKPEQWS
jgi:glycerol-3-phosphate dehydrogenase (NAD(P)+)